MSGGGGLWLPSRVKPPHQQIPYGFERLFCSKMLLQHQMAKREKKKMNTYLCLSHTEVQQGLRMLASVQAITWPGAVLSNLSIQKLESSLIPHLVWLNGTLTNGEECPAGSSPPSQDSFLKEREENTANSSAHTRWPSNITHLHTGEFVMSVWKVSCP